MNDWDFADFVEISADVSRINVERNAQREDKIPPPEIDETGQIADEVVRGMATVDDDEFEEDLNTKF